MEWVGGYGGPGVHSVCVWSEWRCTGWDGVYKRTNNYSKSVPHISYQVLSHCLGLYYCSSNGFGSILFIVRFMSCITAYPSSTQPISSTTTTTVTTTTTTSTSTTISANPSPCLVIDSKYRKRVNTCISNRLLYLPE